MIASMPAAPIEENNSMRRVTAKKGNKKQKANPNHRIRTSPKIFRFH